MRPERMFWEKATAIHVFCAQGEFRGGERFARHWRAVTRLDATGYADAAIADKALAQAVANLKRVFFKEKDTQGEVIDYRVAVSGGLQLVPQRVNDASQSTRASQCRPEAPALFMRIRTVVRMTGLGRSTIYRLMADKQFPTSVRLGPRAIAWRRGDLESWSEARPSVTH